MNASKKKGTSWESEIVRFLTERGWLHAERRTLAGVHDRGDISGIPGVVIEAKNTNRVALAEWLDEAEHEGRNAKADVAAVWAHRRGRASAEHGYVIMTGDQFARLLRAAGY